MSEYAEIVAQCAAQGRSLQRVLASNGEWVGLRLCYRASEQGKGSGKLMLVRSNALLPEGVEWVNEATDHDTLGPWTDLKDYYQWIFDRCKRVPVLSH